MSWYPIAFLPPQIENGSGVPYSGAVLKAYRAGTSTPIPMATDYTGVTTTSSMLINASGYPTYQGTIVIPHIQENYKLALYPNQAAADANSGAIWNPDNIQIAPSTNSAFIQYFDGDGVTATFTLSQNFGTDENILMVFADRSLPNYVNNGDFASDTVWSKGAGWTISGGVAVATGAISTALTQNANVPLTQGQSYTVEFTVTASAGTVTPSIGGNSGTTRGAGTFRETIIAGSTQVIAFTGVGFTGTIDNVSIKDIYSDNRLINRPDEYTLVGNQLTLNNIPPNGTKNVIVFAPSLLLGAANNSAAAAATSEANALAYKNSASADAAAVAALYDSFDDRYLGSQASDPTLDNDGNALLTGALYWNNVSNVMKVYSGTVWATAYVGAGGFLVAANNLSDISNATTARTNISAAKSGANTDITSLNAPALGAATATTQSAGDNSTKVATTAFVATASKVVQNYITGLLASTQSFVSNISATINFSNGQATDSTNTSLFTATSLPQWSVANGNAANGYQGGTTLPNSTTIHFFVIALASDTTWTATFASTSLTPTLPGSYTKYRRITSMKTNASGVLPSHTPTESQGGGIRNVLTTTIMDINTTVPTSRTLFTLSCPSGIKFSPHMRIDMGTNPSYATVFSPDESDQAPAFGSAPGVTTQNGGAEYPSEPRLVTNTSGQIAARAGTAGTMYGFFKGWDDFRRL